MMLVVHWSGKACTGHATCIGIGLTPVLCGVSHGGCVGQKSSVIPLLILVYALITSVHKRCRATEKFCIVCCQSHPATATMILDRYTDEKLQR